ncbi:hypothetical protein [Clostridioides sp. ZZV14-6105]|uniref:hypothetical protein n=1 Tax=Clostridioides sp. ZZV14-6105 TaxID=2811492 RepID=UPI001D12744D|nr:hypothetical protein [Clostridioides sp. ZZV14-6105]
MKLLLNEEKEYKFFVADTFESNMLVPIIKNGDDTVGVVSVSHGIIDIPLFFLDTIYLS